MPNYKKMYFHMFNSITDVIDGLDKDALDNNEIVRVIEKLKQIQLDGEEMYIDTYDEFSEKDEE